MIVFELTMPHVGSWNGKWSGADRLYIRTKRECDVPKDLRDRDFHYRWEDGWEACVSVRKMPAKEAVKLERKSNGFAGYDWMVRSIVKRGYIVSDSDMRQNGEEVK